MASDEISPEIQRTFQKIALDEGHLNPAILPWDRFQNWVHCMCIVTFDLELGQAMEVFFRCVFFMSFLSFYQCLHWVTFCSELPVSTHFQVLQRKFWCIPLYFNAFLSSSEQHKVTTCYLHHGFKLGNPSWQLHLKMSDIIVISRAVISGHSSLQSQFDICWSVLIQFCAVVQFMWFLCIFSYVTYIM